MSLLIASSLSAGSALSQTGSPFGATEEVEGVFGDLLAQLFTGVETGDSAGYLDSAPISASLSDFDSGESGLEVEDGEVPDSLAAATSLFSAPQRDFAPVEHETPAPAAETQLPLQAPAIAVDSYRAGVEETIEEPRELPGPTLEGVSTSPAAATEERLSSPAVSSPIATDPLPGGAIAASPPPARSVGGGPEPGFQAVALVDTESEVSVVRPAGNASQTTNNNTNASPEQQTAFVNNLAAASQATAPPVTNQADTAVQAMPGDPLPMPSMAPERVVEAVIERAEAGGGEVHVRLDPPELGEVTIRVTTEGDAVRVHIQVERPEAGQLLRNAVAALESLLSERGLDLSDVFVGSGDREAREQAQQQPSAGEDADTPFGALLEGPSTMEVRQHNRIRSAYNPDGALLYRV